MNSTAARLLTRLYPRAWRERYAAEFEALLEMGGDDLETGLHYDIRIAANVLWSALWEHITPTRGGNMDQPAHSLGSILKHPSAFLPLAMSLTALAMLAGDLATYGVAHEVAQTDEGTVAHLWQLLMAGQMSVVAHFAIKWLPRAPRQTLYVLGLQAGGVLASMAPVYFLKL
jgi:hypothetical protein